MKNLSAERSAPDPQAVALKAFARIAEGWSLTPRGARRDVRVHLEACEEARLAGTLAQDQMPRLSALAGLYKSLELYFNEPVSREWVRLPNDGPEFDGTRPVDAMIAGGLPKILRVRGYVDALRGGM